ncbi:hypothetical protein niasHS_002937 [Heterodera schachtii]|uniref:Glutathione synthetase n=1 Tax=Heterodera schachtii TaxID=97005 RepID=A0ABD2K9A4_HETSC
MFKLSFVFLFCICCCTATNGTTADEEQKVETTEQLQVTTPQPGTAPTFVLDEESVQTLMEDAIDYSHKVFLVTRLPTAKDKSNMSVFAPFTLFPSPYPREMYKQAIDVAKAMSLLYFRISRDLDFMKMVYKDVIASNSSIEQYMGFCEEMHAQGFNKQPLAIYLHRSDYFVHINKDGEFELKQIEFNSGSVGGANGLAPRVTEIHERVMRKAGFPNLPEDVLPRNSNSKAGAAKILVAAWRRFKNPAAIIVSIVHKQYSYWHFLKRYDEYEIDELTKNKVKIVYLTVFECAKYLTLDDDLTLRLKGEPVAVVYANVVMTGHKMLPETLALFKMIERSTAFYSSTVCADLSQTKIIQQVLTRPGMVEKFFPSPKEAPMVAAIRKTFAKIWALDNNDDDTKAIIADAIAFPDRYVLKPNREGGGKNFWGQDIVDKLSQFTQKERASFILMEKLNPLTVKNYLVWPNRDEAAFDDVVMELGVYGFMLGNRVDGTVPYFDQPGHLVRTKLASSNEGGISVGTGAFDSVYLY